MQSDAEDADAPGRVPGHGEDMGFGAAGQVGREKSQARIVSAWDRRNCDQGGPVRRSAGSIPACFRISHAVDAATFTPRPASSPQILRYLHSGSREPAGGPGPDVLAGRRPAGPAALGSDGPAAPDDLAVPAQDRSGVTSSHSPWRRAWESC